jgi:hypothetical protein
MIRISTRLTAVSLAIWVVLAAVSSQRSLAQAPAVDVVALTGARVIDGTGRAPLGQATLISRNGRIEAVGAPAAVTVPPGATRVDMAGKTIMPGMMNAHAHLNIDKDVKMPVRDQLVQRLRTYADFGVTSAVSLGSTEADELEGLKLRDEQARGPLDRARLFTGGLNCCRQDAGRGSQSVDRLADLKVDVIKFPSTAPRTT